MWTRSRQRRGAYRWTVGWGPPVEIISDSAKALSTLWDESGLRPHQMLLKLSSAVDLHLLIAMPTWPNSFPSVSLNLSLTRYRVRSLKKLKRRLIFLGLVRLSSLIICMTFSRSSHQEPRKASSILEAPKPHWALRPRTGSSSLSKGRSPAA